jgi:hypothetical protein
MDRFFVDPAQAALPRRPWRKVHLDFHNSQHVPRIGERFDADEFGNCLVQANVDAIVVFAKDMHGYFYYPSRYGPVHPGLSFDLLGAQVEACRKRGIAAYAYYCTAWDNYLAEHHPEWLLIKRDRSNYLPKFDEAPAWTALCLAHEGFVQLMLDHATEFVARYELDGAWFDMPVMKDGECFCHECLERMRAQRLDPFSTHDQRHHKHALHKRFIESMTAAVRAVRPGCQVDYNNQGLFGLDERAPFMDNIDIEALPTAFWGYYYFPLVQRYARVTGRTTYGMTGRFQRAWADFGGLKLPAQLHVELAGIVANGARCDIGDQPPPHARLDPAVYDVIGEAYGRIKSLEPYLDGAVPVTEAALVTGGLPLDTPATEANYGLAKLLIESRIQFDVVEPHTPWERYRLVILSEQLRVDVALAERLHDYASAGGRIVAVNDSGLISGTQISWLERYGLSYHGTSPFKPAYVLTAVDAPGARLPPFEYALYEGATRWRADAPARSIARLGEPMFQRSAEHYTSHAQTPFDAITEYSAVAESGPVAQFAFPLGLSYFNMGYWVYRSLFRRVLSELMPDPLVETDAPLSTEVTMTYQSAGAQHGERCLVHIVNWSSLRQSPRHPTFYEDPIPLTDVHLMVRPPIPVSRAHAAVAHVDLPITPRDGGSIEIVVPRIPINEIVCLSATDP